jgi:phosphoribosylaminoimidazole carboxylase (NCAIR synthetase)
MNIVLVSPQFPPNFYNFAVAARRAGANVLGIGDAPYDRLRRELREALTEYFRVDDMDNYGNLIRACGYFTYKYGKLDRLESHNEYWLETDARLRVDFNIPGLRPADMAKVKQKSRMKRVFTEAGLEVPAGALVNTLDEARGFVESVGYPVVAKPDVGVGAARTYRISTVEQLEDFWATKSPEPYVLESFVVGKLHSFDGLADREGRIVFATAHTYEPTIMEVVNRDVDVCARSFREIPVGLEEAGRRAVEAFDVRERFFHIEFFYTPEEDRWLALEMNMRPPGGPMLDVFNYANDIDIYQQWANVVMFNTFTAEYSRPYYACFVGRKRSLTHAHGHSEIMAKYGDMVVHHEQIAPIFARAMGHHAYLLRSPDLAHLEEAIDFVLALRPPPSPA